MREHQDDMSVSQIAKAVGRARSSVHHKLTEVRAEEPVETPPTKPTGVYIEALHAYVVDNPEVLSIWCKWNGYYRVSPLSRDKHCMYTIACFAK